MTVQVLRKKFAVDQYYQMIKLGMLAERDRVELLQGGILEMSPISSQQATCVDRLAELFVLGLSARAIVRVQIPIHLSNDLEP